MEDKNYIEIAEKVVGRKLKNVEKLLVDNMYDENIYDMDKDKNGNLILNIKNATKN